MIFSKLMRGGSRPVDAPYSAPRPYAEKFRAQATGTGNTRAESERTGACRAVEVVEAMPAAQRRAVPACEGYPAPPPPITRLGFVDSGY